MGKNAIQGGVYLVNKQFYLPTVGLTYNICRVSSIYFLVPPAAKTKSPVDPAYSRLPRLAAPPPPYCTLKHWLVHPSIPHMSSYSPATLAPNHTTPELVNPRTPLYLQLYCHIFYNSSLQKNHFRDNTCLSQ